MKSKRANAQLQNDAVPSWQVNDDIEVITHDDCITIVELAEEDAEKRCRERAIKAFEETICPMIDGEWGCDDKEYCYDCDKMKDFIKACDNEQA
jgi:hypothetical protein